MTHAQVAQSLASAVNPNNATRATVSSTQAYNTASTFTAAAAKANRVQPSLSAGVSCYIRGSSAHLCHLNISGYGPDGPCFMSHEYCDCLC